MRLIDADELIVLAENTFSRPGGFINLIEETETAYDVEKVAAELKVVFERIVAEILDKTGSDFTIADFNLKPFTDRVCAVVRNGGAE